MVDTEDYTGTYIVAGTGLSVGAYTGSAEVAGGFLILGGLMAGVEKTSVEAIRKFSSEDLLPYRDARKEFMPNKPEEPISLQGIDEKLEGGSYEVTGKEVEEKLERLHEELELSYEN